MITITQREVRLDSECLSKLRSEFEETGIAMLPGFLSPGVLNPLMRGLERTTFEEKNEAFRDGTVFGTTFFVPQSQPVLSSFYFILNREPLFRVVHAITDCVLPRNYLGRIHRTTSRAPHHIDWHNDAFGSRVVGLNINLSASAFSGGIFQQRGAGKPLTREIKNWRAGDAFLFRISSDWQHRLTPVEAGERTVGVGWFRSEPEWSDTLLRLRSGLPQKQFQEFA